MNVAYNLKFNISAAYIAFLFISILLWDLKRLVDVGAAHFQTIHLMILHFITLCQSRAGERGPVTTTTTRYVVVSAVLTDDLTVLYKLSWSWKLSSILVSSCNL